MSIISQKQRKTKNFTNKYLIIKKEQWLGDHIWGSFSTLHYKLFEVVKFNSFKMDDAALDSNNLSWASFFSFQ